MASVALLGSLSHSQNGWGHQEDVGRMEPAYCKTEAQGSSVGLLVPESRPWLSVFLLAVSLSRVPAGGRKIISQPKGG